jgi:hypothetical protein
MVDPEDISGNQQKLISELTQLQKAMEEKVNFGVFNVKTDENLKFTLECYQTPCSYYMEHFEGKTHALVGE